jgi:hypothetical protein
MATATRNGHGCDLQLIQAVPAVEKIALVSGQAIITTTAYKKSAIPKSIGENRNASTPRMIVLILPIVTIRVTALHSKAKLASSTDPVHPAQQSCS